MPGSLQSVRIDTCAVVITNSNCSCDNCDSVTCFTRRRQSHDNCSCFRCQQSKTCLYLAHNDLNIIERNSDVQCNKSGLFSKCKHVKSSDHIKEKKTEPMVKIKVSDKCCGKEVNCNRMDQMQSPIKINALNDIAEGVNMPGSCSVGYTTSSVKSSRTTVQSSVTTIHDDESATGKLSAQIMNVPYTDYIKSVHKVNSSKKVIKWNGDDILNKIKEAYKACSCKVCECINKSSFLQPANDPNICNCKPCDCVDCRKMRGYSNKTNEKAGKPCINKAYNEMGKIKVNEKCNCKPCECVQCKKNDSKTCDCKPCECAECKANIINSTNIKGINSNNIKRTVIVAPVGEENSRAVCTCTPCDCMACASTFGSIATSMTHEMSTGMSRPRNCRCDTCLNDTCDQEGTEMCQCSGHDKLMRKPVLKDSNDYDIRSAVIDQKFDFPKDNRNDAITMYTKLAKEYSSHTGYDRNNGDCNCDVRECILCKHRFGSMSSGLLPQTKDRRSFQNAAPKTIRLSCKCSPCECEICHTKDHLHGRDCKCKVCECLDCAYSAIRSCRPVDSKPIGICKCSPCECIDCPKEMAICVGDNHTCNFRDSKGVLCKNKNIRKENLSHFRRGQTLQVSMAGTYQSQRVKEQASKYCKYENYESKYDRELLRIGLHNEGFGQHEIVKSCHANQTAGLVTYVNPYNVKVSKYNLNEDPKRVVEVDRFPLVGMSRLSGTNGDSSCANNTEPKKQMSDQSSCISSGHDHSDYLIKFPRSAVETCINDVLKFNLDKTLNLTQLNISSMGNSDNGSTKSPQYSVYCIKTKSSAGGYQGSFRHIIAKPMPSNDWHLAEGCKCSSCDCKKCLLGKLKAKKCNCDCVACDCVGSCLSEDKSFLISKNEGTQTKKKVLQDRGQDSLNTNNSSIELFERDFTSVNTQLYPLIGNHMETERNHENVTIERNNIKTYGDFIECPTKCPDNGDVNVHNMPIQINYDSVQSTIREAREFSLELLQILKKYEKANREFESISEKLRCSREFSFDNSVTTVRNVSSLEMVAEKENGNLHDHQLVDRQVKLPSLKIKLDHINRADLEVDNKGNNVAAKVYENLHEIPTKDMSESCQEEEIEGNIEMQNTIEQERKGIESLSSYIFDKVCKKIFDDSKEFEFRNRYRKYRKLIKRAVSISKRFQVNSKNELVKSTEIDCRGVSDAPGLRDNIAITNDKVEEIDSFGSVKNENKIDDETINIYESNAQINFENNKREFKSTSRHELIENEMTEIHKSDTDVKQTINTLVKITEKKEAATKRIENNISLTIDVKPPDENNNSSYVSEKYSMVSGDEKDKLFPLEVDVKNAIHSISSQMSGDNNNPQRSYFGIQTLENLHSEVQKLLIMPQLQIQGTTYYFSEPAPSSLTEEKYCADTNDSSSAFDKKITEEVAHCSYKNPTCSYKNDRKQQANPFVAIPNYPYQSQIAESRSYYYDNVGTDTPSHATSNCDAMKVSFYGVRRVSDHTILVKWNPPCDMKDVQGYELLVDGYAVQKILSPTRCMAVVTCLPHSERVLLAVRTLTARAPPALCPTATFVYRPRVR